MFKTTHVKLRLMLPLLLRAVACRLEITWYEIFSILEVCLGAASEVTLCVNKDTSSVPQQSSPLLLSLSP